MKNLGDKLIMLFPMIAPLLIGIIHYCIEQFDYKNEKDPEKKKKLKKKLKYAQVIAIIIILSTVAAVIKQVNDLRVAEQKVLDTKDKLTELSDSIKKLRDEILSKKDNNNRYIENLKKVDKFDSDLYLMESVVLDKYKIKIHLPNKIYVMDPVINIENSSSAYHGSFDVKSKIELIKGDYKVKITYKEPSGKIYLYERTITINENKELYVAEAQFMRQN